jgi:hypothetical protein
LAQPFGPKACEPATPISGEIDNRPKIGEADLGPRKPAGTLTRMTRSSEKSSKGSTEADFSIVHRVYSCIVRYQWTSLTLVASNQKSQINRHENPMQVAEDKAGARRAAESAGATSGDSRLHQIWGQTLPDPVLSMRI